MSNKCFLNCLFYLFSCVTNDMFLLRIFSAGLIKCSTHVPLYQAWACLEMRSDNLEKAKALIGEALSRDKNQGSGWLIAAKIEDRQGNKGLAKLVLQRGLKYAPNDATLYCAMAEYEVESGKIQAVRILIFEFHLFIYHFSTFL